MIAGTQEHVSNNEAFLVILGGLLSVLGIIAAASPFVAGLPVPLVVGGMILCRGSMQFYYGIKVRHWGRTVGSYTGLGSIVMSFISVACGVLLLADLYASFTFLSLIVAGYLIVTGGSDILHALELRDARGWQFVLLNGLVAIGLGVMVGQQWPIGGYNSIGLLAGGSLMASGCSLIGLGMARRLLSLQPAAHESPAIQES